MKKKLKDEMRDGRTFVLSVKFAASVAGGNVKAQDDKYKKTAGSKRVVSLIYRRLEEMYAGKVMVLHMIPDIEGDQVQWSILAHWFRIDHQRAQSIEKRLQEEPHHLPDRSAEEPSLKICGDVDIQLVASQIPMVVDVVLLERGRVGQPDGQVGPHGKPSVPLCQLVAKGHVVRDVMNSQSQGVVDAASEDVSPEEDPLPGEVADQTFWPKSRETS
ncbi:hypothetical protein INR49_030759 [Caranx melampygus]|nr:hypothetical protein INR49_030759 [Caranx melampygus]